MKELVENEHFIKSYSKKWVKEYLEVMNQYEISKKQRK